MRLRFSGAAQAEVVVAVGTHNQRMGNKAVVGGMHRVVSVEADSCQGGVVVDMGSRPVEDPSLVSTWLLRVYDRKYIQDSDAAEGKHCDVDQAIDQAVRTEAADHVDLDQEVQDIALDVVAHWMEEAPSNDCYLLL